jgi:TRAP transporter TAXI family solute receptor
MLKQKIARFFIILIAGCLVTGGVSSVWAKQKNLILSTATTGGTYYPVGVAIATLTSLKLAKKHKITMTAITSAGSGENVQLLKSKEADMAILQGLFGSMAWQGKGKYAGKPQKHLNSVTMLWQNVEHFVIQSKYVKSGNMADLKYLKGQAFSIGKRGSGTETSGRTILSALGFNPDSHFKLAFLGYTPSAKALQDSRVSGINIPAGPPVGSITQAFASIGGDKIRILDFTPDQLKMVNSNFSVWTPYTIKKGTYPGQKKDVKTIAQPNFMAVNPEVDAEVVYLITKNIYENLPFLHSIHKATKAMALEKAIAGLPVPLHPGAAKFYQEKGLKIPKHLIR